jgi:hypothetical protein
MRPVPSTGRCAAGCHVGRCRTAGCAAKRINLVLLGLRPQDGNFHVPRPRLRSASPHTPRIPSVMVQLPPKRPVRPSPRACGAAGGAGRWAPRRIAPAPCVGPATNDVICAEIGADLVGARTFGLFGAGPETFFPGLHSLLVTLTTSHRRWVRGKQGGVLGGGSTANHLKDFLLISYEHYFWSNHL